MHDIFDISMFKLNNSENREQSNSHVKSTIFYKWQVRLSCTSVTFKLHNVFSEHSFSIFSSAIETGLSFSM